MRNEATSSDQQHFMGGLPIAPTMPLSEKGSQVALEQYKIIFNVIINLNDAVVKGVFTLFLVFSAFLATIVANVEKIPTMKYGVFLNYGLILVFMYYFVYLRIRIKTLYTIADQIERMNSDFSPGVRLYLGETRGKFFSTVGLFIIMFSVLAIANTAVLWLLW